MRYRKLDNNGDYSFGLVKADFLVNSPDTVAQAVLTRLNLWVGEWFANIDDGTGWTTDVLGKGSSGLYEMMLRQRVLGTPGVKSILDFQAVYAADSRKLTVHIRIDTVYGQGVVNGELSSGGLAA